MQCILITVPPWWCDILPPFARISSLAHAWNVHAGFKDTVPAEQSLHLIPGLFGFAWVATEYKPGLIMSYKV